MGSIRLDFTSQLDAQANRYYADCAVACVSEILKWAGKPGDLRVNTLAAETTLAQGTNGIDPVQAAELAQRHGLNCHVVIQVHEADIKAEIDQEKPVVAFLPWNGGHSVVIAGYDNAAWTVHDPAIGIRRVSFTTFDADFAAYGRQAIFITDPPPAQPATVTATANVNLRLTPGGAIVGALPRGAMVSAGQTVNGWTEVTVYVKAEYVR